MPVHDAQLAAGPHTPRHGRVVDRTDSTPVGPHAHRHVVARADEHVARVRAPRDAAHGELVARQQRQRPAVRLAQIEGADDAVDARRRYEAVRRVLVPVVGEDLGRLGRREVLWLCCLLRLRKIARVGCWWEEMGAGGGGLVHRNVGDEVVLCGGGGSEVEDAEARVGGDGGEEGGVVWGEGDGIGAGADGEGAEGFGAGWGPLSE